LCDLLSLSPRTWVDASGEVLSIGKARHSVGLGGVY
jgi:hypothetical protein